VKDKKLSDLTVGDVAEVLGWSFVVTLLLLGGLLLWATQC